MAGRAAGETARARVFVSKQTNRQTDEQKQTRGPELGVSGVLGEGERERERGISFSGEMTHDGAESLRHEDEEQADVPLVESPRALLRLLVPAVPAPRV